MSSAAYDNSAAGRVSDSSLLRFPDAQLAGAHAHRLHDESEPWKLFDALLHGRLFDLFSLWEIADYLRLPSKGPFIVIAAEVPEGGGEALPGIESKLRSLDVCSAWRQCPEVQVGIVHLRTENLKEKVVALVSRMTTTRVGVSSQFDDLRDASQALRYARMMLHGHPEPGQLVSVFDDSILAGAAVSAPEAMSKLVAPMLEKLNELPDDERDTLLRTFWAWAETGGSPRTTGELLFCHRNTVLNRLRRIEQCTGRSLSRPRDLAELCLAFEVHRRLL